MMKKRKKKLISKFVSFTSSFPTWKKTTTTIPTTTTNASVTNIEICTKITQLIFCLPGNNFLENEQHIDILYFFHYYEQFAFSFIPLYCYEFVLKIFPFQLPHAKRYQNHFMYTQLRHILYTTKGRCMFFSKHTHKVLGEKSCLVYIWHGLLFNVSRE